MGFNGRFGLRTALSLWCLRGNAVFGGREGRVVEVSVNRGASKAERM